MKRSIALIGLLTLMVSGLYAQEKPFKFGFEISPNIGWLKSDQTNYENDGSEVGFSWGFVSEFHLMENYAISTGFRVVYLNGRLSYPYLYNPKSEKLEGTMHTKYNVKYLQVPIVLKMKTRAFGKLKFYGKVGLGTGIMLTAKGKDKFKGEITISEDQKDIKDQMLSLRESLILGAGVEYDLGGSTVLTFGIGFDNGFTDVLKDQNTLDPSVKNQAINNLLEFNMGIIF
jgi:Outer membrane protein beta-barrel domain